MSVLSPPTGMLPVRSLGPAAAIGFLADALRAQPIALTLFAAALTAFGAFHFWRDMAPPPAKAWNSGQLTRIQELPEDGNLAFAVFGDPKSAHGVYEQLLRTVESDPEAQFALCNGDLVAKGDKARYRHFFRQVRGIISKPLLGHVGNHETYDNGRPLYRDIFGPFNYSFAKGNAYFIALDNADCIVTDSDFAWLREELAKAQAYPARLVFMHMPPYDPRGGGCQHAMKQDADKLAGMLAQAGVDRVFCGHVHGYYECEWQGVPYTISGGAGSRLVGEDPAHHFWHYMRVEIDEDGAVAAVPVRVRELPQTSLGWLAYHANRSMRNYLLFQIPRVVAAALPLLALIYLLANTATLWLQQRADEQVFQMWGRTPPPRTSLS